MPNICYIDKCVMNGNEENRRGNRPHSTPVIRLLQRSESQQASPYGAPPGHGMMIPLNSLESVNITLNGLKSSFQDASCSGYEISVQSTKRPEGCFITLKRLNVPKHLEAYDSLWAFLHSHTKANDWKEAAKEMKDQFPIYHQDSSHMPLNVNSLAFLEEHHIKPLQKGSELFPDAVYYCHLCHYHLSSVKHVRNHFEGGDHMKVEERIEQRNAFINGCSKFPSTFYNALNMKICSSILEILKTDYEDGRSKLQTVEKILQDIFITTLKPGCRFTLEPFGPILRKCNDGDSPLKFCFDSEDIPLANALDTLKRITDAILGYQKNNGYAADACFKSTSVQIISGTLKERRFVIYYKGQAHLQLSRLLRLYTEKRPFVSGLMRVVRYWAKICELDRSNSTRPGLAHHAFDIMVIHFLQKKNLLPIIPISQVEPVLNDCLDLESSVTPPEDISKEDPDIGTLFLELLAHYCLNHEEVVQITRSTPVSKDETKWLRKMFHIVDPFRSENVVTFSKTFQFYFFNCFISSYVYLSVPRNITGPISEVSLYQKLTESPRKNRPKTTRDDVIGIDNNIRSTRFSTEGGNNVENDDPCMLGDDNPQITPRRKRHRKANKRTDEKRLQIWHTYKEEADVTLLLGAKHLRSNQYCNKSKLRSSFWESLKDLEIWTAEEYDGYIAEDSQFQDTGATLISENTCSPKLKSEAVLVSTDISAREEAQVAFGSLSEDAVERLSGCGTNDIIAQMSDDTIPGHSGKHNGYTPDIYVPYISFHSISRSTSKDGQAEAPFVSNNQYSLITPNDTVLECDIGDIHVLAAVPSCSPGLKGHLSIESFPIKVSESEDKSEDCVLPLSPTMRHSQLNEDNSHSAASNVEEAMLNGTVCYEELYIKHEFTGTLGDLVESTCCGWTIEDYCFDIETKENLTGGFVPEFKCTYCDKVDHDSGSCPCIQLLPLVNYESEPSDNQINDLCKLIEMNYVKKQVSRQHLDLADEFVKRLRTTLEHDNIFKKGVRLDIFGSLRNGFGIDSSDVDLCLRFKDDVEPSDDPASVMRALSKPLRNIGCRYDEIRIITNCKVPIVKFVWSRKGELDSKIDGDISFYNDLALANTRLLNEYSLWGDVIDDKNKRRPRVKLLGLWIKMWAKTCGIGDASNGSLSSYAYILLMIHFLQNMESPVLPRLQDKSCFKYDGKPKMIGKYDVYFYEGNTKQRQVFSKNKMNVGHLFIGFLDYYSQFDFANTVVQIRQKNVLTKLEKEWNGKTISIEDPFELDHNLGRGVSHRMAVYIQNTFRRSRDVLRSTDIYRKFLKDSNICEGAEVTLSRPLYPSLENALLTAFVGQQEAPPDRICSNCKQSGHRQHSCPYLTKRKSAPFNQTGGEVRRRYNFCGQSNGNQRQFTRVSDVDEVGERVDNLSLKPSDTPSNENHTGKIRQSNTSDLNTKWVNGGKVTAGFGGTQDPPHVNTKGKKRFKQQRNVVNSP